MALSTARARRCASRPLIGRWWRQERRRGPIRGRDFGWAESGGASVSGPRPGPPWTADGTLSNGETR